jgi:hypothetical protein
MINLKKTPWVSYVLSSLIFACTISCENPLEKVNPDADQGVLQIRIGLEMKIFTASARVQEVNTDDFLVSIKNANDEVYLSFGRAADMPASIPIDPGSYYIEVESPNDVLPAFDNPKYFGQTALFTIDANEVKVITATASLANCMVSVVYSQHVMDQFTDYYTVVSNSQGSITFATDELRMGYFDLIPITIESFLSYPIAGGGFEMKTLRGEILVPEAQTHYQIHVDGSLDQGSMEVSINVDETYTEQIISINDQGTPVNEGPILLGDLLITEIMYNPTAVSDTEGEWLEIYNNSPQTIDLFQVVLKRGTEVQHVINENIFINPQQYMVLARHLNGTSSADYIYGSDLTLTNSGDDIVLANYGIDGTDGQVIASVNYGNAGFPDATGASINLDLNAYDVNLARDGTNWCVSTLTFDAGDLGTPGVQNESCSQ